MKVTTERPASTLFDRSSFNAPTGLALRQRNGPRRSFGSDSGRISRPYRVLAKLKPAATQNGSRGSMPPSRPPSAGPRMNPPPKAHGPLWGVGKPQPRRDPERQPRIHAAKQAAERGSENESRAERDADLAE